MTRPALNHNRRPLVDSPGEDNRLYLEKNQEKTHEFVISHC